MSTTTSIPLGTAERLTVLYSYPNFPGDTRSLAATIEHWFGMTLDRDGFTAQDASLSVQENPVTQVYELVLSGPDSLADAFAGYAKRLPQFLANGWDAWANVVPMLQNTGKWDPCPDQPASSYLPWRFFLPHGMPMLNQKALLFFHYPPIRLLDTNQDYLNDPVPVRCEELLAANGVTTLQLEPQEKATGDIMLFNTVMDATPIGAEDDQGSKSAQQCTADGCPATAYDPTYGLIPIQHFPDYQKAQVSLLLNASPTKPGYTAPIVVYGAHPLQIFNTLYNTSIHNYAPIVAEIIPGLKTPVLASSHPYVFYGKAQGFDAIGSGIMPAANVAGATAQMLLDLAVAGWLTVMSEDPSQDPVAAWNAQKSSWASSAQAATVSALVDHQGSLLYSDPKTLAFSFKTPLVLPGADITPICAKSRPVAAAKPAVVTKPATAPKRTAVSKGGGLQVLGDDGNPVDWWFMYKISKESKPTGSSKATATGAEYLYFDSVMAAKGAKPVLSKNSIDKSGAFFATYSQLFTAQAKANKDLGYFCYNDEDRYEPGKTTGTGPSPCGHCKGALAFDLASDSALWIIHSVPLLPLTAAFAYPPTGFKEAQTLLCIQLQNADASKSIAQLIYDAHGPNVNVSSDMLTKAFNKTNNFTNPPATNVPKTLGLTDPRVKLMQNQNGSSGATPKPYAGQVPFNSKGGQKFLAIAKNRAWGDPACGQPVKDFYDVLVSTALNENLEVETWEDCGTKVPQAQEQGETHDVENMHSVNLSPLGIPWSWDEQNDHAKLAISDRNNPPGTDRWVCVGDINFTDSMEKRGGGTCAFICNPLWQALSEVLSAAEDADSKLAGATSAVSVKRTATAQALKPTPAKAPASRSTVSKPGSSAAPSVSKKVAAVKKAPVKKAAAKKAAPKKKSAVNKVPARKAVKKAAARKPAATVVKKKVVKKTGKKR